MALKPRPIWDCAKTKSPHFRNAFPDLVLKRCVFRLDLGVRTKWESGCVGVFAQAQTAITPVEDDKPSPAEVHPSDATDRSRHSHSTGFHKDLNLLPKPLSAMELSLPDDGTNVRVAYQGLPGAYSEAAARKAYPKCETVPCDQFEAAFKAVELWLVDKAVLPIENSVGGSIHRNYDLLLRHRLYIVGEVQLVINHCLLGLPGVSKEELKCVLSHPQALAQCEMTLCSLGLVRISAADTAGAAQMVASIGKRDTGAVASAQAAEIYGLDILAEKIQDDDDNVTRFFILAREPKIAGTDRPHKTSIVFTLEEGPGMLFTALAVFALRDINLTKIESRPQRKGPVKVLDDSNRGSAKYFDYLFYIDFEASMADPRTECFGTFAGVCKVSACPWLLSYGHISVDGHSPTICLGRFNMESCTYTLANPAQGKKIFMGYRHTVIAGKFRLRGDLSSFLQPFIFLGIHFLLPNGGVFSREGVVHVSHAGGHSESYLVDGMSNIFRPRVTLL